MITRIDKVVIITLFITGILCIQAKDNANELIKVLYHEGKLCDRIVLFFSEDSTCSLLPESTKEAHHTHKKVVFFVPHTSISMAALEKIKGMQKKNMACALKVYENKGGLAIEIAYDPRKISVQQSLFDPINNSVNKKGIVFQVYENDTLNKLKAYNDTTIHYAFNAPSKKKLIVVDAGHGGSDHGAVGCFLSSHRTEICIAEKDIALNISKKIVKLLNQRGKYRVLMTRTEDKDVSLDKRTTFANSMQADLFISIHANAALNNQVAGFETFWTPKNLINPHFNALSGEHDLHLKRFYAAHDVKNARAASVLHKTIMEKLIACGYHINDRKVKARVAQVNLCTDAIGILCEVGFVSNSEELKRLSQKQFQYSIAHSIVLALDELLEKII